MPVTAAAVPTSPLTPTTSTNADVSARRSCPRCARRMSSLQFAKHSLCVVCRDVNCSLDTRCEECISWSLEFMLGYVKHQRSWFRKGRRRLLLLLLRWRYLGYCSSSFPPSLTVSIYGFFSYVLFFGGWVAGCVVSLLFLCKPSFLHEVLFCFLS